MKQTLVLAGCAIFLLGLAGCQNANRAVKVIVEGDGQFPEFLTGTWKADKHGWEFVFEPDGRISSAVVSLGRVRIKPGRVTTVPMKKGGKGVYEPGEWMVYYAPISRELTVKISLKNFYMESGRAVVEGESTVIFVGPVSENGKVWYADCTSLPEYVVHTAKHPHFEMSEDPNYGITYTVTFEKVRED